MITSEIISRFNLQIDDASELSSSEELALANEVYTEVCNDRPWEWLKVTKADTTSITLPYLALPTDFKEMSLNKDNKSVVFIGTDYQEYKVIPFSSRRDYRDQDGYCYLDIPNSRLYFTLQPVIAKAVEYDYIKIPALLTLSTSPLFDTATGTKSLVISYGMSARFPTIEQADKNTSYANENKREYLRLLSDLSLTDANIKLAL